MSSVIPNSEVSPEVEILRARLAEVEETLRALRGGTVDALVIGGPGGDQLYSREGAETPYRSMVEAMHEGTATLMEGDTILYCNHRFADMLRIPLQDLIGSSFRRFVAPSDLAGFDKLLVQCKQCPSNGEFKLMLQGASALPVQLAFNALNLRDTGAVCVVATDLTERNRREAHIQQLAAIVESTDDAIITVDFDGVILTWNPGAERMLGYHAEEVIGQNTIRLLPEICQAEENGFMAKLGKGESINNYETVRLKKDGTQLTVSITLSLVKDGSGKAVAFSKIIRDISERKRTEKRMGQMQTALEESNRALQRQNEEIRTFYHTLSHELKTPLTSAREFVAIVIDGLAGPLNQTQLEYLGIAKESCDQLRLYINDLLDITRLETGRMSLDIKLTALAPLLERVVEMLAPAAAGKGVSLSSKCQADLPPVPIDKQRILQVLINLVTNAIKFTPAGGEIRLSLSESAGRPDSLQVAVRDTGVGIPKEQLELIFGRLYQVKDVGGFEESRNGLGLGLYICQELVQLHSGRLTVESELGQGSTFTFTIPKRHEPAKLNVLVVDDEAQIRDMLRKLLERQGYQVTSAGSGDEALRLMRQQRPALVILDLQMPGMGGAETLDQIRSESMDVPVVLHTGYPEGDLMEHARKGNPLTVLAKPCPMQQMLNTVLTLTQTNQTARTKTAP